MRSMRLSIQWHSNDDEITVWKLFLRCFYFTFTFWLLGYSFKLEESEFFCILRDNQIIKR